MLGGRIEWIVVIPFIFVSNFSNKNKGFITTLLLLWLSVLMYIFDQDIPGEGERWQAFLINIPIFSYLEVYSNVGFLLLCASLYYRQQLSFTSYSSLILWCIGVHLLMSSFNDYGSRHIFPIWFAMGFIIVHSERIWIAAVLLHLLKGTSTSPTPLCILDVWKHYLLNFHLQKLSLSEPNCARVAESDVFNKHLHYHISISIQKMSITDYTKILGYSLVLRIRTMEMDISRCFRILAQQRDV